MEFHGRESCKLNHLEHQEILGPLVNVEKSSIIVNNSYTERDFGHIHHMMRCCGPEFVSYGHSCRGGSHQIEITGRECVP